MATWYRFTLASRLPHISVWMLRHSCLQLHTVSIRLLLYYRRHVYFNIQRASHIFVRVPLDVRLFVFSHLSSESLSHPFQVPMQVKREHVSTKQKHVTVSLNYVWVTRTVLGAPRVLAVRQRSPETSGKDARNWFYKVHVGHFYTLFNITVVSVGQLQPSIFH